MCMYVCMYEYLVDFFVCMNSGQEISFGLHGIHVLVVVVLQLQVVISIQQLHLYICMYICMLILYVCMYEPDILFMFALYTLN